MIFNKNYTFVNIFACILYISKNLSCINHARSNPILTHFTNGSSSVPYIYIMKFFRPNIYLFRNNITQISYHEAKNAHTVYSLQMTKCTSAHMHTNIGLDLFILICMQLSAWFKHILQQNIYPL